MIRLNTSDNEIDIMMNNLPENTVIAEFSGRDSVAAVMKILNTNLLENIVPVASFAGTEFGEVDAIYSNYDKLVERVLKKYENAVTIHPLIIYSNPNLWHALNARFTTELVDKFGFYTPCIGCHAYFHLLRMPMARQIGRKLISGEREGHENRIKVNQLGMCLDTYEKVLKEFDVELMLPIRKVSDNNEIEELIGWDWEEGKDHPDCVYSGNYRNKDGKAVYNEDKIKAYLDEFLVPACIGLGKLLLNERYPTKQQMVEVVSRCL